LNGCKTSSVQQTRDFPQPNWLERRWDRFETWNRQHGYPMEKARDITKMVIACTVIAVGAAVCGVAYFVLQSELDKLAEPKMPNIN